MPIKCQQSWTSTHLHLSINQLISIFFHSSLNAAMNTLKERLGHITLTQKGGHVNVNINDIFYIESDNPGKCIVNFENTSITHHGTMSSLNSEISISGHNFVRVHTSYTVNPLHLKCFNSSILQLSNGVSKNKKKSYRSCFMKKCGTALCRQRHRWILKMLKISFFLI